MRDAAARVVRTICVLFGDPLHNIRPRISKTLIKALTDSTKPVTTHYGALRLATCCVQQRACCSRLCMLCTATMRVLMPKALLWERNIELLPMHAHSAS